ncbi:MAG: putative tricarboxylic transport rane protein [Alphaproteobacteria bacterium]|jgi:tripartite-type tricarboxylate transporter receptor subunit TctC|nr:putative tricarboxylic transport rane protein [Alphaproteobacteria bacterium]MEA3027763.1 putative tricarboxylic transport rane protein [Alphaproteobacteria bacterium]
MKLRRRRFLQLAASAAAVPAMPAVVRAQVFPSRPVTMVVPVPAGGALDTNARLIASGMSTALGQTVVIENVTGASGSTGTGRVARSAPDGYTLIYGANVTHVLNAAVLNLNYDVVADFEPIALIGKTPWFFAAKNDLPANNLREMIAWLKDNPDKASLGTAGNGSPSHIAGVLFQNVTATKFQLIPYRGVAPVIPDLVSGQIELSILDPITSLPQFRAGKIKIFAVLTDKRTATAPDIPTVDEAGALGVHMEPWQAIWAPKGTPKDVIAKLNAAVVSGLSDPVIRQKFADQSYELTPRDKLTPEYLAVFHKGEMDKWFPIIKAAGIKDG